MLSGRKRTTRSTKSKTQGHNGGGKKRSRRQRGTRKRPRGKGNHKGRAREHTMRPTPTRRSPRRSLRRRTRRESDEETEDHDKHPLRGFSNPSTNCYLGAALHMLAAALSHSNTHGFGSDACTTVGCPSALIASSVGHVRKQEGGNRDAHLELFETLAVQRRKHLGTTTRAGHLDGCQDSAMALGELQTCWGRIACETCKASSFVRKLDCFGHMEGSEMFCSHSPERRLVQDYQECASLVLSIFPPSETNKEGLSLPSLLDLFHAEENVPSDYQYCPIRGSSRCDSSVKKMATKEFSSSVFIHLKRHHHEMGFLTSRVHTPWEMTIGGATRKLVGAVVHETEKKGDHYVAMVLVGKQWCCADDLIVTPHDQEHVLHRVGEHGTLLLCSSPDPSASQPKDDGLASSGTDGRPRDRDLQKQPNLPASLSGASACFLLVRSFTPLDALFLFAFPCFHLSFHFSGNSFGFLFSCSLLLNGGGN